MKWFETLTPQEKFEGETVVQKNIKNGIAWLLVGLVFGWFLLELWGLIMMLV